MRSTAFPLVVLVDDSEFAARTLNNWLWVTFTRSNPAADVHGVGAFTRQKHWGCDGAAGDRRPHQAAPRAAAGRGPGGVAARRCAGGAAAGRCTGSFEGRTDQGFVTRRLDMRHAACSGEPTPSCDRRQKSGGSPVTFSRGWEDPS